MTFPPGLEWVPALASLGGKQRTILTSNKVRIGLSINSFCCSAAVGAYFRNMIDQGGHRRGVLLHDWSGAIGAPDDPVRELSTRERPERKTTSS